MWDFDAEEFMASRNCDMKNYPGKIDSECLGFLASIDQKLECKWFPTRFEIKNWKILEKWVKITPILRNEFGYTKFYYEKLKSIWIMIVFCYSKSELIKNLIQIDRFFLTIF